MAFQQEIIRLLRASVKKYQVPGASVAILRNGRVVAKASAGVISLNTKIPTSPDTIFQIGSITKPFTATLIMQLVDEGRVDLDTPIVNYLPEFRVADLIVSNTVTPRHFLSHQSGIDGDLFLDSGRGDDSIEKLISKAAMVQSLFPMGENFSYCNLGFAVLGRLIEVITGQTYDAVLKERIFIPLDMDKALSLPEEMMGFSCAIGHVQSTRKKHIWYPTKVLYLSHGQKAAGSTPAMTASNLLQFADMHINAGKNKKGKTILSTKSVKSMQRIQVKLPKNTQNSITAWGLGWFLMDWNGHKLYGHDGATIGQYSFLRILPEKNLAVAILTNGGDAKGLAKDIFAKTFHSLAKISEPPQPNAKDKIKLKESAYIGFYQNMSGVFKIESKGDHLCISFQVNGEEVKPKQHPLKFIDIKTAKLNTGDSITDQSNFHFSDKKDNKFQYLSTGLRQFRRITAPES